MGEVISVILRWVEDKLYERLPPASALAGEFEVDTHSTAIAACNVGVAWALRLRQPDTPLAEADAVPGRVWTTELAIRQVAGGLIFGCRVICSSHPSANLPIRFTRPRILIELSNSFGLLDDLQLLGEPTVLHTPADLERLGSFVQSAHRKKPAIVLSEFEGDQGGELPQLEPTASRLAKRLHCLAHVFALPRDLAADWIELVGREWAVFGGGVRTYQPNLNFESQAPYEHPLLIGQRVLSLLRDDQDGPDALSRFFAETCIEEDLSRRGEGLDYYSELRLKKLSEQSADVSEGSDPGLIRGLREQVDILKAEIDEYLGLVEQAQDGEITARNISVALSEDNRLLRHKVDALNQALASGSRSVEPAVMVKPSGYRELSEWVRTALAGQLKLLPRAERVLKDAVYEDLELVVDALQLLARDYRNMEMGIPGAHDQFHAALSTLGLSFGKSITPSRAGEQGDAYEVTYPRGGTAKRFLEWHLKKGNSKDEKLCLRIYFFFDSDINEVVVGWLPSHLDTRTT